MSRWFRVYDDAMHDPKVQSLPPPLFKFWFNLLCVASKNDGVIPPLSELKSLLKARLDHLETYLKTLLERGLIDEIDGCLEPHNWRKRQYKSDVSTARVRAHREAAGNVSETPPENREQIQKEVDDGDDAQARVPVPAIPAEPKPEPELLISREAMALADEIAVAVGHDLKFVPLAWCGAAARVDAWLKAGWPRPLILETVRTVMAHKRDGPPDSVRYFERAIAKAVAASAKPLPRVVIDNTQESVHVQRNDANRSLSQRAAALLADFTGPEPSGGPGSGSPVVRLLSKG